jgi:hypothetical protein
MRIAAALLFSLATLVASAEEPTAFELIKEGNRYVGEQSKDKVVQIRSERSVGTLTPKVWFVVYHDPTATFKAVEVKFAAGKMIDVKRPFRVIELAGGIKELPKDKLEIDSDDAIEKALKEPILKDIAVKSVQAKLENSEAGPLWRIRVWAAKISGGNSLVDIGRITVAADDGKVIETDIKLNRLD